MKIIGTASLFQIVCLKYQAFGGGVQYAGRPRPGTRKGDPQKSLLELGRVGTLS